MLAAGQRADRPAVQEHQKRMRPGRGRQRQQPLQRHPVMAPGDNLDPGLVGAPEQVQRFVSTARPGADEPRRSVAIRPDGEGVARAPAQRQQPVAREGGT